MASHNMPAKPRFALYMQDKHPLGYELEMAEYAESRGFSEIWQADTRLARDCVTMMAAFLTRTRRLRVGSGVLPIWTRNAGRDRRHLEHDVGAGQAGVRGPRRALARDARPRRVVGADRRPRRRAAHQAAAGHARVCRGVPRRSSAWRK